MKGLQYFNLLNSCSKKLEKFSVANVLIYFRIVW